MRSIPFLSVNRVLYIPPTHPNGYFYPYVNKAYSSNLFCGERLTSLNSDKGEHYEERGLLRGLGAMPP